MTDVTPNTASAAIMLARLELEVIDTGITSSDLAEAYAVWEGDAASGSDVLAIVTDKKHGGYRVRKSFALFAMRRKGKQYA